MKSFIKHINEERKVTPETAAAIGKFLGIDFRSFTKEALAKGIAMEDDEHGGTNPITSITNNSLVMAARIAIAHLNERPDYYDVIDKIENGD